MTTYDYTADKPEFRKAKKRMYRNVRDRYTDAEWKQNGDDFLIAGGWTRNADGTWTGGDLSFVQEMRPPKAGW